MTGFVPSHYLVRTPDLKQAVADYERAGFTVVWGSDPDKAYNALIYFKQGGFIELFDPPMNGFLRGLAALGSFLRIGLMRRFHRWIRARGFCDYALECHGPLKEALQGTNLPKPRNMSRVRDDGVKTRWQLSSPKDPYLPFVMGPYDPPLEPDASRTKHENGITRIVGLGLSHPDPNAYGLALTGLLADADLEADGDKAVVRLPDFTIEIGKSHKPQYTEILVDKDPPDASLLHGLVLRSRN